MDLKMPKAGAVLTPRILWILTRLLVWFAGKGSESEAAAEWLASMAKNVDAWMAAWP